MIDLKNIRLEYEAKYHRDLPHVVKFSGGRSSGALLIALLEQGLLDASRGDVVLFNNTSAEHPATYDFIRKCKSFTEKQYCIPFFWIEYVTYEDAYNGDWTRQSSFQLVHDTPFKEENPNGYHWKGEVFEELVSMQGFLPSRHTRSCTAHLKLQSTYDFLAEWFAAKDTTFRLGHYYEESQITDKSLLDKHRKFRGRLDRDDLLKKKKFLRSRPLSRPSQKFDDYSVVGSKHIKHSSLANMSLGDVVDLKGDNGVEYISIVGLRFDEQRRVVRVKQRNSFSLSDTKKGYENEIICTPLADSQITQEEVLQFWQHWHWDLELPHEANLSNCVYCFMKGTKSIARINHNSENIDRRLRKEIRSVPDTPSDINWWVELENKYRRRSERRNVNSSDLNSNTVSIGFWGVDSKESYQLLRDMSQEVLEKGSSIFDGRNALPCDCTD